MLQWMGGSRRKVTASRKSTHNRQKQYFEQRKRQQQTPVQVTQENNTDGRNKRTHYHEEPRSLDILSLINLASVAQQGHSSHRSGSEPETISPNKLSSPFGPQNVPAAHRTGGKRDVRKILASPSEVASKNTDAKLHQKEEAQNDVSVLDLISDDEPKSNSEGRSVPEAHVAFSVEGLGKVGIETPAHSPRLHGRAFPSTPKASRRIQPSKHRKSIPYDLRLEPITVMHDIKMSHVGSPSESICNSSGIFDDLVNTTNEKFMFSCKSRDAYENLTENCHDEEEIFHAYKDGHKKPNWNTRFSILDDNVLDGMKYDTSWKSNSFQTERYPSFPSKAKKSETYGNRFGDSFSESSRSVFEAHQRSEVSASSAPYLKHLRPEKDYNCSSFDWDRLRADNETSDFDSMSIPPTWSFLATEDSQDSISLLSEESCSSTAVREERSYRFGSDSVKLKDCKINHIGSEKKYVADKFNTYADLDEAPWEKNLAGTGNYESMRNQRTAGYCSKYSSSLQGILEPESMSFSKEGYTPSKVASFPSSYKRTSIEIDTGLFGHDFMPEDNLFDMFPDPNKYPTTDFKNRKFKSKILDEIREDDVLRDPSDPDVESQKPLAHPLGTERHFPYSYCVGGDLKKDAQFPDLSRQQSGSKNNERGYKTVENPQEKDSIEKKSSSSVNGGTAVMTECKSNCSEREESKGENQELFDGPTTRDRPFKAEEAPLAMQEATTQPASCTDEKLDHCNGNSPVPSLIEDEDSMREKFGPGRNSGSKGGGNTEPSYQVMLESYVLQLLCVQKVLMEASERDIKKV